MDAIVGEYGFEVGDVTTVDFEGGSREVHDVGDYFVDEVSVVGYDDECSFEFRGEVFFEVHAGF